MLSCNNGAEVVCVIGLAFDYASQTCLPANELNCKTSTTTTSTETTTIATSSPTIDYSQCPSGSRFSPHPTDCSKFLQCEKSTTGALIETEITCPGGLLFNSNLNVCDWAQNVVCTTQPTKPTTTAIPLGPSNEYLCLKDGLFPSPLLCAVYYGNFIYLIFFFFVLMNSTIEIILK